MRNRLPALTWILISGCFLTGCISKSDLYGNWKFGHHESELRKICTENYYLFLWPPGKGRKQPLIAKDAYEVRNYGLFLRVHRMGTIDNVYNFFGFVVCDHTNYWLGFIPLLGFQYSRKISDLEMLEYLQKYQFTPDRVIDVPVSHWRSGQKETTPDHSVPALMEQLDSPK
ncbi:MAG: hypothetical protein IJS14_03560 [Lentisphaeria bacterium]|nr:hypothetical protein [Lentisphaeria bacterium]